MDGRRKIWRIVGRMAGSKRKMTGYMEGKQDGRMEGMKARRQNEWKESQKAGWL